MGTSGHSRTLALGSRTCPSSVMGVPRVVADALHARLSTKCLAHHTSDGSRAVRRVRQPRLRNLRTTNTATGIRNHGKKKPWRALKIRFATEITTRKAITPMTIHRRSPPRRACCARYDGCSAGRSASSPDRSRCVRVRPAPCPSFLQTHPCPIVQPRGAGSTALRPSSDHGQTPAYREHRGTPTCVCPVRVTRQGRHLPTVDFPWRNPSLLPNDSRGLVACSCGSIVLSSF